MIALIAALTLAAVDAGPQRQCFDDFPDGGMAKQRVCRPDIWQGRCSGSAACLDDGGVSRMDVRIEDASEPGSGIAHVFEGPARSAECEDVYGPDRRRRVDCFVSAAKGQPSHVVTIAAAGDVTLGYHLQEYVDLRLDGSAWGDAGIISAPPATKGEMVEYPFAKVAPVLKQADLAVVNLEGPLTDRGEKIPKNFNFRAPPESVQMLVPPGIDVVTIANNHMMDYGPDGIRDTIAALDKVHIAHFGAGMNLAEARKPAIVEREGEKIAFLGYLYIGNPPIEPLIVWAQKDRPGVAGAGGDLDALLKMIAEDVKAARKKADVVVVFFHFGKEGLHEIQPYEATIAHAAVDAGANLVLGSHPHVLQGAELYKGVPIVYSLGNFVFGGNANPKNKESAIFECTLAGKKATETRFVPVQITRVPEAPFQPFPLDGADAKTVLQHLADYSKDFATPLLAEP